VASDFTDHYPLILTIDKIELNKNIKNNNEFKKYIKYIKYIKLQKAQKKYGKSSFTELSQCGF